MSLQSSTVAALPIHWCMTSWTIGYGSRLSSPWTESVWFSSAKPVSNGNTIVP